MLIYNRAYGITRRITRSQLQKIELLKEAGMDPFTAVTSRTHTIAEAISGFEMLTTDGKEITLSGRVLTIRGQGALLFFNFTDGTGNFQGLVKKGETDDILFKLFVDTVDSADFIEVTGTLFCNKNKSADYSRKELEHAYEGSPTTSR